MRGIDFSFRIYVVAFVSIAVLLACTKWLVESWRVRGSCKYPLFEQTVCRLPEDTCGFFGAVLSNTFYSSRYVFGSKRLGQQGQSIPYYIEIRLTGKAFGALVHMSPNNSPEDPVIQLFLSAVMLHSTARDVS